MNRMLLFALATGLILSNGSHLSAAPNTLTPEEKQAGWKLLFDGQTTDSWRGYASPRFPDQGWRVKDGWLEKIDRAEGGDIMTKDTFSNFELQWEWKIVPGGNNGVKYFILQERNAPIGHEYQMMDDMGKTDKHSTASFYEVLAPAANKLMKPAGEINHSRILVRGDHVEHWLNGRKVLEYELGSEQVMEGVANSKFKNVDKFGTKVRGHILLTDHRDGCWFRDIKIRELSL